MPRWDVHDSAVAPSPIVPTYLPALSKRRHSSLSLAMTSRPADMTRPRGGSAPRPQARSAGMAERPTRNESLVDLVQFFQTQSVPTEPTAALPDAESRDLKPFHRRLLHFTQRPKKDASPKSKVDESQRQIEALQREGYLLAPPKSPQKSPPRSKGSLDRSLSKSKRQDVENIGQPWVEKSRPLDERRRRLASLDLGDFGSIMDIAVSLSSDFDDSMPPPYQASAQHGAAVRPQSASTASPVPSKPAPRPPSTSPAQESEMTDIQRLASSANSTSHAISHEQARENTTPETPDTAATDAQYEEEDVNQSGDTSKRSETLKPSTAPQPSDGPAQPSLRLFPVVAPPRNSSKHAWRISATPRYQTPSAATSVTVKNSQGMAEPRGGKPTVSTAPPAIVQKNDGDTQCSGAPAPASDPVPAQKTSDDLNKVRPVPAQKTSDDLNKVRPPSLSMNTLKAFPLPAPTKPLPSVPETGRAPSAPPDSNNRIVWPGPKSPGIQPESSMKPLEVRPATALGNIETSGSNDVDDGPKSPTTSSSHSQYTPKRRSASVRVSRMQELPESDRQDNQDNLEESPVLGRPSPTKPRGERTLRKGGLQINPHIDRKNLPFGLPSPPPTAPLPDPHVQPTSRSLAQRNYTAPTGTVVPSVRGLDLVIPSGCYRSSIVPRSNSSRSNLRHEKSCHDHPESPFPSSDEEGFGPGTETSRSRRHPESHQHARTASQFQDPQDARQVPIQPRYPHAVRPLTPQSRSTISLEKTWSPQSQYSQSTYRSRESQSSHRAPVSGPAPHYLEDRIATLERKNKILQAALLAALDVRVKNPIGDLQSDQSAFHAALENPYLCGFTSRPESWVSSSRNSENSVSEAPSSFRDGQSNVKQLDNMIEDFESGWVSEKSTQSKARVAQKEH